MSCIVTTLCTSVAFAQQGEWEPLVFNFGDETLQSIGPVHIIHVYDGTRGKMIAITAETTQSCPGGVQAAGRTRLWSFPLNGAPGPGTFEAIPLCRSYTFCGGHSALADGRILVVGGGEHSVGTNQANLFDPDLPVGFQWNLFQPPNDMAAGRWYPTCTTLADGKVFVCSGNVDTPERFDPATGAFTQLTSATLAQPLYPYMFVLPDGNLVDAGPGDARMLITSNWTWSDAVLPNPTWWPTSPPGPMPGQQGSCVMYEPGKIMKCGGVGTPPVGTTVAVDLNNADPDAPPAWLFAGNMNVPRFDHNLVTLPDGSILAVGGSGENGAVYAAERYDPGSATWTVMASSHPDHSRQYHSTAVLLPDGRVVVAGGDDEPTAQIYKPPYITANVPRPNILSAPAIMQYGQQYTITYSKNAGSKAIKVCLIRLASVTHGFDHDQRRVPLTIVTDLGTEAEPGLLVSAPANGNIAPPGYYMLFILNEYAKNKFAPCTMAAYVKVGP